MGKQYDKEKRHQQYLAHRDEVLRQSALWRAEHKEQKKATSAKYYAENQDKIIEHRIAHRDERKERCARWRAEHPEKVKANNTQYYAEHGDEVRARAAQWRKDHPEQMRATQSRIRRENYVVIRSRIAQWQAEHPEKVAEYTRQHKLRKLEAMINDLTLDQWAERVAEFNGYCAYCLKPMDVVTMDHMIPLSKGGNHTLSNVVPCCKSCNSKKGTLTLLEFVAGRRIFPDTYRWTGT